MAQVKSIRTDKQPISLKHNLDDIPEQKPTTHKPLIVSRSEDKKEDKERTRAGRPPISLNPYGKPKVIEDGRKVK